MSHLETSSAFARALNRVISDNRFTVTEMAEVAGVSDRHLYNVRSGDADLAASKAERLARWLCRHGETRLSDVFLCPEYAVVRRASGTSNGEIKDELVRIVHAMAEADTAHDARDGRTLRAACDAIREALGDLQAEADALTS
jgi:hypothetical protein